MIKILLIVAAIGSLAFIGFEIDKRGYQRGKSQAESLAAEAITKQNQKIAALVQKHNAELGKAAAIRKAERRKADEQIRKLLVKYKEFETWWNTVVHSCALAYIYGVHNEGCPDYVIPGGPRADSRFEIPGAQDWEDDKWRHRPGYEKSA